MIALLDDGVRRNLTDALCRSDEHTRDARADRIALAAESAASFGIIAGRAESLALLDEARTCYVNGQNIAALIVALSYVEHALADALNPNGDPNKLTLEAAIRAARGKGLFDDDLLDRADQLRKYRNPYVHRRPGDDADTLGARIMALKEHPRTIQEGDAIEALKVMYGFLRHELHGAPRITEGWQETGLSTPDRSDPRTGHT